MRKFLSYLLLAASAAALVLIGYLLVSGFPAPEWLSFVKLKDIRKPFQLFFALFLLSMIVHPDWRQKFSRLNSALATQTAFWLLISLYLILFAWHEIAEFLAIQINFIPFGFYDYMLYYFFHGQWHYTGLLHGFYHINNAMLLLAPIWKYFQSPLLLVFSYPVILVSAAIPLYYLARRFFSGSALPFVVVFSYLNYRYLENMLEMNFTVEGFYPLFLFALIYFAVAQKWVWYGLFLLLTLSVKEDAPFYLAAFGFLLLWMREKRIAGAVTIIAAVGYYFFIRHFLVAWTGSDIFSGTFANFKQYGSNLFEIAGYFLLNLPHVFMDLLGNKDVIKTLTKSFGHLLFLPVFSPWTLAALAALFPLFVRGGESFVNLQFQYAGPFIGFLFPALVDGLRRIWGRLIVFPKAREVIFAGILIALVFLNGGNFRIPHFDDEELKTIAFAVTIPEDSVLVTHGHLLPYVGYRKYNFYFMEPMEDASRHHPDRPVYENADYYYLARNVNPYPMDAGFLDKKLAELKARSDYDLVEDDGTRYVFKRKT